jgi:hypothetical protein
MMDRQIGHVLLSKKTYYLDYEGMEQLPKIRAVATIITPSSYFNYKQIEGREQQFN